MGMPVASRPHGAAELKAAPRTAAWNPARGRFAGTPAEWPRTQRSESSPSSQPTGLSNVGRSVLTPAANSYLNSHNAICGNADELYDTTFENNLAAQNAFIAIFQDFRFSSVRDLRMDSSLSKSCWLNWRAPGFLGKGMTH